MTQVLEQPGRTRKPKTMQQGHDSDFQTDATLPAVSCPNKQLNRSTPEGAGNTNRGLTINDAAKERRSMATSDIPRRPIVAQNYDTYRAWKSARNRCNNPTNPGYPNYGGRGITFTSEWDSFERFLSDMGPRPSARHSLDRIDVNGPYAPGNCRWATPEEQANNKRNSALITFNGKTLSVRQWSRELGISSATLEWRLQNGWSAEKALTEGVQPKGAAKAARTRCANGHPYSEWGRLMPGGYRKCVLCSRENDRRKRERQKGGSQ